MASAPRIWLDYRPPRIGWLIAAGRVDQLATAANWNTCLWGGQYNPLIPLGNDELAGNLVKTFAVDFLMPVEQTNQSQEFIAKFPHIRSPLWTSQLFEQGNCYVVDIRHAVKRVSERLSIQPRSGSPVFSNPSWSTDDPLSVLFDLLFGRYPDRADIGIDYAAGVSHALARQDFTIRRDEPVPPELLPSVTPLTLTASETIARRDPTGDWLWPAIVVGKATNFDDLILFWNLRAAGARAIFVDRAYSHRLEPYMSTFMESLGKDGDANAPRIAVWRRGDDYASLPGLRQEQLSHVLDRAGDPGIWNGLNVKPHRIRFSFWHRDVIPGYSEEHGSAFASFALPDQPFDQESRGVFRQHFVVSVEATQFGLPRDDITFNTPYVPALNEFYHRSFSLGDARSEPGTLDRGAVGMFTTVGTQSLSIYAYHVRDFLGAFFDVVGIRVAPSKPGLICSRLIQQLGGMPGCSLLKVRGSRRLISKYGPDASFTRGSAVQTIAEVDPQTNKPRWRTDFNAFSSGSLAPSPSAVFDNLVSRGVFRVGLELRCPNCELDGWTPLDDVRTTTPCIYCGHQIDVTRQLKDRDWRYRRSGLFGREDHQEGGIPVALTVHTLERNLHDSILMYSTGLNLEPKNAKVEHCESDFIAIVAGKRGIGEAAVQIVVGEAKTGGAIDAEDVRKLSKIADAIPHDLAEAFIIFSKTGVFSPDEIQLGRSLNATFHRKRVILLSEDELEPYFTYSRSSERLGQRQHAVSLTDMAEVTDLLWFRR